MRVRLFFLFVLVLITVSTEGICSGKDKILDMVKSLGSADVEANIDTLEQLAECPREAAFHLVRELHQVPEQVIRPEEKADYPETMHVVWCIRALRYLTNGLDFTGKTTKFDEYNEKLEGLPTGKDEEVYFFSDWMSREIIYIAPEDAQAEVIRKWKEWYSKDAEKFTFKPSEHLNDWYF